MVKSNTLAINLAKSKAKKIKKLRGVSYSEALNLAAVNYGYSNFKHLQNSNPTSMKELTGVLMSHQNKMSLDTHVKTASLLKDILSLSYHRRSVYKEIDTVRCELDNWTEREHQEWSDINSLSLYYDDLNVQNNRNLSQIQFDSLSQKIDEVVSILTNHYSADRIRGQLSRLKRAQKNLKNWLLAPVKATPSSEWRADTQIKVGTVVNFKKGSGDKSVIVLAHDVLRSSIVYCNYEGVSTCDRSSIRVPRIPQPSSTVLWPMRLYMPYGKWTLTDGTEVLYNRNYQPIWWKTSAGKITSKKPQWVMGIQSDEVYFNDGSKPWEKNESKQKCERVLKDFGVLGQRSYLLQLIDNHIPGKTKLDFNYLKDINRLK
jgi:hypothetical protein